ncbi:MAG: adenylyltransferase/cytidyltransferase family protein [Ilumatobacteraceae bacterium]|nr:adenylyltransferase/cytidyltransferase family protein [Ilumatobacteraceae bacterium]
MSDLDRHRSGLIVGRFDPPHLGHSYMIDWAADRCEQLVVYVNTSTELDAAPGELRAAWLSELHPHVEVIHVPHSLHTDWDDEALWAKWLALFRDRWPFADGPHAAGPDALFSSDPYIDELARRLDATAVVVDAERTNVPISATQIREAPGEHLHRLAPPVRAWVESEWL